MTFTARAAGEMRGRLRALGVGGRPGPHLPRRRAAPAALLLAPRRRRRAARADRRARRRLVAEAAGRLRLAPPTGPALRDLAAEIEWAKVDPDVARRLRRAAAPAPAATPPGDLDAGRRWRGSSPAYEEVKRAPGPHRLRGRPAAHRRGRSRTGATSPRRCAAQYRHFVVDEYQDVNPLQQRLLDLWLGGRDDLCVVGDASQTIYSFTGATPAYLLDFPRRYPAPRWSGWSATTAPPRRSWRSRTGVLRTARARPPRRRPGSSWSPSARPGPEPTFTALRRRDRPRPPASPRECAALLDAGVPAARDRRAVPHQRAVRGLRGGADRAGHPLRPARRRAVLRAARGPAGGPPAARAPPVPSEAARRRRSPAEVGRRARRAPGWDRPSHRRPAARPGSAGSRSPRWSRLAEDFVAAPSRRRRSARWSPSSTSGPPPSTRPTVEGVTLASLHAAKGLEWDAVFLVGARRRHGPDRPTRRRPTAVEEERRLLYVGVTRAREHLRLSWAVARNPGGRAHPPAVPVPGRAAARRHLGADRGRRRPARPRRPGRARGRSTSTARPAAACSRPPRERKRGPLRRLPARRTTRRSTTCSRPGGWRASRARRSPPTSCSPTRRSRRSPRGAEHARGARHHQRGRAR